MQKKFNHFLFLSSSITILLVACSQPNEPSKIPTAENVAAPTTTQKPSPTPLPTATATPEEPVTIVVPPPLPTTLPDQRERLAEVKENLIESPDFVIDTAELDEWRSPTFLPSGDYWYKHTAPNNLFTIIIHGFNPPEELSGQQKYKEGIIEITIMRTDYSMGGSYHIIGYFENPSLINGELTTQEYLNTFLDSFSENVTILSDEVQLTEVEKETNIQMNGFPGRDYLIKVQLSEDIDKALPVRFRCRTSIHRWVKKAL